MEMSSGRELDSEEIGYESKSEASRNLLTLMDYDTKTSESILQRRCDFDREMLSELCTEQLLAGSTALEPGMVLLSVRGSTRTYLEQNRTSVVEAMGEGTLILAYMMPETHSSSLDDSAWRTSLCLQLARRNLEVVIWSVGT